MIDFLLNSDKDAPINVGINLNKSSYRRGDTLELDVNVDRDSTYLACFYQDASKSITQVYPNPVQGESITSKNNSLKIPGSDAFTLSLNEKGKESVMCMASYYSVADKLQTNFGDAFNPLKADFSGIGKMKNGFNILINRILHKTHIAVDELGTKAGAVTIVEMKESMMIEDIKDVRLDRPFVYMIVDTETNTPIFMGTVMDIGK